jgi:dipeptidyl aminopeptidase/acylaminoacyl peptidase
VQTDCSWTGRLTLAMVVFAGCLVAPAVARATLPGKNGSIGFGVIESGESDTIGFYIGGTYLGVVGPTGRHPRLIAKGRHLAFSPTGGQIAFGPESRPGLSVRPARGGRARSLTSSYDVSPTWSPSGRRIAFTRLPPCEEEAGDDCDERVGVIHLIGRDGRSGRPLVAGRDPSWSSRGQIAFASADGRISVFDVRTRLVRALWRGDSPDWSPRSDRVAFVRDAGKHAALFVGNPRTRAVRRIHVVGGYGWVSDPTWSPDGKSIAFARNGDVYVIRPSGSGLRRLLDEPWCPPCGSEPGASLDDLAWQPLRTR